MQLQVFVLFVSLFHENIFRTVFLSMFQIFIDSLSWFLFSFSSYDFKHFFLFMLSILWITNYCDFYNVLTLSNPMKFLHRFNMLYRYTFKSYLGEWLSDCCFTPTQQIFSYIMAGTHVQWNDDEVIFVLNQHA